jgi:hypothetical protein
MLHYSRENERSQALITELEQRKNTCEAGYVAIVACWTQVWFLLLPFSYVLLFANCMSAPRDNPSASET